MQRTVIALVFLVTLSIAAIAAAAPELAADQPVFDFGSVPQGKKVEHNFVLRNRGNSPLTIRNTSTSCGCTAVNVSSPVIQPGKSGEIKAVFDSANFAGAVVKTVTVESDDPKSPRYTLTIKGTVSEEVVITPRQLNFGKVKGGEVKEVSLSVENKGNRALQLTDVKSSFPQVSVKLSKNVISPGASGSLQIIAAPRTSDRILSGYITIKTSNPNKPMVTIPFYGSIIN
jgi:uncharacterized protein (DUF58 family)